jgi:hypothetical protein
MPRATDLVIAEIDAMIGELARTAPGTSGATPLSRSTVAEEVETGQ